MTGGQPDVEQLAISERAVLRTRDLLVGLAFPHRLDQRLPARCERVAVTQREHRHLIEEMEMRNDVPRRLTQKRSGLRPLVVGQLAEKPMEFVGFRLQVGCDLEHQLTQP